MSHENSTIAELNERIDELDSMNRNHADYIARLESKIAKLTAAGRPPVSPAVPQETTKHWSVSVERNGSTVVTIESNCLSGRDLSAEDARVIQLAAEHLRSFVGVSPAVERLSEPAKLIAKWRKEAKQNRDDRDAETANGTVEYAAGTIAAEACEACADELEAALSAGETPQVKMRTARESLGTMESIGPQMTELESAGKTPATREQELERELAKAVELNEWYQKRCNWYQSEIEKAKAALTAERSRLQEQIQKLTTTTAVLSGKVYVDRQDVLDLLTGKAK